MLMTFLLVVHALLALALVGVILLQRSEGGGLGIGSSSPGGLVSARGAADLLTRSTAVLATLFIASSLGLAMLAAAGRSERPIDTTLARPAAPAVPAVPGPVSPAPEGPAAPAPAVPSDTAPGLPPIQQ